jgi:hemoglobin
MKRVTVGLICGLCLVASMSIAAERASLYQRLGGDPAMRSIASTLIDRISTDPHTRHSFKGAKIARIKEKLAEQLCELSGGPCRYSGDSMRDSHAGHHITEAEFYATVEVLRSILHERGTGETEINELLRLLAPMKRDIVEGPAKRPAS